MRVYGPDFAVLGGDLADYGRNLERRGAYAPIAAISGVVPMMFMTRLRL